jgi:hypothetical protein
MVISGIAQEIHHEITDIDPPNKFCKLENHYNDLLLGLIAFWNLHVSAHYSLR